MYETFLLYLHCIIDMIMTQSSVEFHSRSITKHMQHPWVFALISYLGKEYKFVLKLVVIQTTTTIVILSYLILVQQSTCNCNSGTNQDSKTARIDIESISCGRRIDIESMSIPAVSLFGKVLLVFSCTLTVEGVSALHGIVYIYIYNQFPIGFVAYHYLYG